MKLPHNCIECSDWRDAEYNNECMLMPSNPSKTLEEQYDICPLRKMAKNEKVKYNLLENDCIREFLDKLSIGTYGIGTFNEDGSITVEEVHKYFERIKND